MMDKTIYLLSQTICSSWHMFLNALPFIPIWLMNSINLKKEMGYIEQEDICLLLRSERGHFSDLYCLLNKIKNLQLVQMNSSDCHNFI